MQQILRKVIFDEFEIWCNIINGDISNNRLRLISDFENKEGFNVLILSPRAAGVGLNFLLNNESSLFFIVKTSLPS